MTFAALLFAYFLLHSLLADRRIKTFLYRWLPRRYYRLAYNAVALLLLWPLAQHFPARPLFERSGWTLLPGGLVGLAGLLILLLALRHYRLAEFAGIDRLGEVQPMAALNTSGLNAVVRHPLYLGLLLCFWGSWLCWPLEGLLALAVVTSLYLPLGIYLEERKLIEDFGEAEFINGEVIIHSPVKKEHNDVTALLHQLLGPYVIKKNLGYVGYEKIMISLSRNDYEPDLCFFKSETSKHFKKGQSLFPAPDLVVEVPSKKTAKIDREIKFEDYQAHQVLEYWIIDPNREIIEQYRLNKSKSTYELILKASDGWIECKAVKRMQSR
ncbi:MAG: Uma2 family endonuclease [Bacteroidota bacterium]